MLRFVADENFHNNIVRGLWPRKPDLDEDPIVLAWAAQEGRILLTHDVTTMTRYAYEGMASAQPIPGIFAVSLSAPFSRVIDDILLLAEWSFEGEWEGQIGYVSLK